MEWLKSIWDAMPPWYRIGFLFVGIPLAFLYGFSDPDFILDPLPFEGRLETCNGVGECSSRLLAFCIGTLLWPLVLLIFVAHFM